MIRNSLGYSCIALYPQLPIKGVVLFLIKEFRYSAPGSPGCRNKINANPAKCKEFLTGYKKTLRCGAFEYYSTGIASGAGGFLWGAGKGLAFSAFRIFSGEGISGNPVRTFTGLSLPRTLTAGRFSHSGE